MKDKILNILGRRNCSYDELATKLHIKDNREHQILNRHLDNLLSKGQISYDKSTDIFFIEGKLFEGKITLAKAGFGILITDNEKFFVPSNFLGSAFDGDIVSASLLVNWKSKVSNGMKEAKVMGIVSRSQDLFYGSVIETKDQGKSVALTKTFENYNVSFDNLNEYVNGDVVGVKLQTINDKNIIFTIVRKYGNEKEPKTDLYLTLAKYNLDEFFDQKFIDEAGKISLDLKKEEKTRLNLSDKLIVTIDGDDSKDLDDAISLEKDEAGNYVVGVHIADVSYFVTEGSVLDEEAFRRGTSTYLINKVVAMLPEKLSNDLCSLNPNTEKLTLSAITTIDGNGKIIKSEIKPSIIVSKHRLTYSWVNKVLKGEIECEDKELKDLLVESQKVSKILSKRKQKTGMLNFDLEEAKIVCDENWKAVDIKIHRQDIAESLIEDFMVLANEAVATYFDSRDIRSVYRIHDRPSLKNIEELLSDLKYFGKVISKDPSDFNQFDFQNLIADFEKENSFASKLVKRNVIRTMAKAEYNYKNIGHYGLGLRDYTHFTSPIRRYSDLVVHRLLRHVVFENNPRFVMQKSFEELTGQMNKTEENATMAERFLDDIKKCDYMMDKIGNSYKGYCTTFKKFGVFVEMENSIEGLIPIEDFTSKGFSLSPDFKTLQDKTGNILQMGSAIKISVAGVSKIAGKISFNYEGNSQE